MIPLETGVASDASGEKMKLVMVVDSETDNRLYLSMLLNALHYRTASVRTAAEALTMAAIAVPALFIFALRPEDPDVAELALRLRNNAGTAAVPFITLRRSEDRLAKARSLELGAVDCLDLPVSPETFYQAVQAATEARPRKCIRLRTILPVIVSDGWDSGAEQPYSLDLSEGGMFLRTTEPAPVNTKLSIRFDLNEQRTAAEAAVIYTCQTGRGPWQEPGMGLAFVRIAPEDRESIRRFIRDEILRGIRLMNFGGTAGTQT
jgi:CheY-like chemotaxis protein